MPIDAPFDLSGRLALVTGCRRGIGRATASVLAEDGADILAVNVSLEQGSEVRGEVESYGRSFSPCPGDLGDRETQPPSIPRVVRNLLRAGRGTNHYCQRSHRHAERLEKPILR